MNAPPEANRDHPNPGLVQRIEATVFYEYLSWESKKPQIRFGFLGIEGV